jgi:hypothetical protein
MSYTPIGLDVAKEVLEAMRLATARFWYEWQAIYDAATQDGREALQQELQEILESLRAAEGDWEHVDFDPSSGGLAREVFTKVWQDSTDAPLRPVAIWLKNGATDTAWAKVWPVSVPASDDHLVKARNVDATTVGGLEEKTASSDTIARERFTDPVDGIEKVRFNASPVPATGGSWLYTGSIQATNLLDPVVSFVSPAEGGSGMSGFNYPVGGIAWG